MRRCHAPSQVAKRLSLSPVQSGSKYLRQSKSPKSYSENDHSSFSDEEKEQKPPYSSPYSPGTLNITSLSCDINNFSPKPFLVYI